jgi:hypothetical protein
VRRSRYVAIALVCAAAVVLAQDAAAARADSSPTTATFTINGGSLSITTPGSASLGTVTVGAPSVSAALGTVTVSDQRAQLSGSWTATVSTSTFTTGAGTAPLTIPIANVGYVPGSASTTSGTGTFTPGSGGALSTAQTAFTATAETGVTSCSWSPTVTVTLPSAVVVGTYTGTITHSVA